MTIMEISELLRIPAEQILGAARELGIRCTEHTALSEGSLRRLQPYLLRSYEPGKKRASVRKPLHPEPVNKPEPKPESKPVLPDPAPEAPAEKPKLTLWDGPVDPRMERLVLEKRIMIDTCSLMHDKCENVIRSLLPALQKHGKEIVIPEKVIDELRKHQKCVSDPIKANKANQGMRLCRMLQKAGCLSIRGAQQDNFADNTFFVVLSNYRSSYHMLLITQDRGLSHDILQLNHIRTVEGYPIEVMYINGRGELSESSPA